MAITYEWDVTSMKVVDVNNLENIVIQTYWSKKGTDENGNEGIFYGATPLPIADLDPNNFVPYNQLTKQIVINWIQDMIKDQNHINEQIQKNINLKKNPLVEKPLPWV
jgi:hypothetical protein